MISFLFSHVHASCSTHSSTQLDSFFAIMYGACKSQSFRRNTGYDKRFFLSRVLWCHSTKLLRTVLGKFKREILVGARSPLLCTADRHYQVSQERLTFAKNLKSARETISLDFFYIFSRRYIIGKYFANIYVVLFNVPRKLARIKWATQVSKKKIKKIYIIIIVTIFNNCIFC